MSGYRTWTPGEVITASDVQSYLQDQAVLVFPTSAARSSAIPVPIEGMLTYNEEAEQYQYYTGASWEQLAPLTGGTQGQAFVSNGTAQAGFGSVKAEFVTSTVSNKSTNYTVVATDANTLLNITAAGTVTFPNALANIGDRVDVLRNTSGSVVLVAGSGVTSWAGVGTAGTGVALYINTEYSAATVLKTGASEYRVIGAVSA